MIKWSGRGVVIAEGAEGHEGHAAGNELEPAVHARSLFHGYKATSR